MQHTEPLRRPSEIDGRAAAPAPCRMEPSASPSDMDTAARNLIIQRLFAERDAAMNEYREWRRHNSQSNPAAAAERREIEARIRAVELELKKAMKSK